MHPSAGVNPNANTSECWQICPSVVLLFYAPAGAQCDRASHRGEFVRNSGCRGNRDGIARIVVSEGGWLHTVAQWPHDRHRHRDRGRCNSRYYVAGMSPTTTTLLGQELHPELSVPHDCYLFGGCLISESPPSPASPSPSSAAPERPRYVKNAKTRRKIMKT